MLTSEALPPRDPSAPEGPDDRRHHESAARQFGAAALPLAYDRHRVEDPEGHFDAEVARWFDGYAKEPVPELAPFVNAVPYRVTSTDPVTGEVPRDTFNTIALPLLRGIFPYYVQTQQQRVATRDGVCEVSPAEAFLSDAFVLRLMFDGVAAAATDGDEILLSLDNDKTMSRKPDDSLELTPERLFDEGWERMTNAQRRRVYHQLVLKDLEATVTRPAVIAGIIGLKHEYGDMLHIGMTTSNVQEYLDLYTNKLNAEVRKYVERHQDRLNIAHFGHIFEEDYVISYVDGRYVSDMRQEIELTRARGSANPSLRELLSSDISPVYCDADRYIDFESDLAQSVSAQDLKPPILMRVKDEDPRRRLSIVHLDDLPSAMRADSRGIRYISLPMEAWFDLLENSLF